MFDTVQYNINCQDANGSIEPREVKALLGSEIGDIDEGEIRSMIQDADMNKDGKLDIEDFLRMMQGVAVKRTKKL